MNVKQLAQIASNAKMSAALVLSVIDQAGGMERFAKSASGIVEKGAENGWSGFTYYYETCSWFDKNRAEVSKWALSASLKSLSQTADAPLEALVAVLLGHCTGDDEDESDRIIKHTLAWVCLAAVAHIYGEAMEQDGETSEKGAK